MENFESLSHVRWECKYHIVFIPKYRRKVIYGKLRGPWADSSGPVSAERSGGAGRACDARPRPPVPEDSAEILRCRTSSGS